MAFISPYTILRNLLMETAHFTGEAFLKVSARAFAGQLNADFVFITQALDSPADTVRMLAAWRDGKEINGWEFALPGTPCELIYQDEPEDAWKGVQTGSAVAIAEQVCRRFAATRNTTYEAFIGVPLWENDKKMIGHVALFFKRALADEHELNVMLELVELFSFKVQAELNRMLLEQARESMVEQLKKANERLERDSITDSLTELYNRRHFNQRAQQAFMRFNRCGEHYALVLLDFDHFKSLNDNYGHDFGDTVLCRVAEVFQKSTRADVEEVFRIGGEEFAILCHGPITAEALRGLSGRIKHSVKNLQFTVKEAKVTVTVSIGAALPHAGDASWDVVYVRADKALYAAKKQGRDTVVVEAQSV